MNYLINTSLNAYDRFAAMIRSLFVALAKRDIEEMTSELRHLPKDAQVAMFEAEEVCRKRIKEIKGLAIMREMELKHRIAQTRHWIESK